MSPAFEVVSINTLVAISGIGGAAGAGRYFSSNVTISFSCSGEIACVKTYYCVDSNNTCNATSEYRLPFNVSSEGKWFVRFYSLGENNEIEKTSSISFTIDKMPPIVAASSPSNGVLVKRGENITTTFTTSDNTALWKYELYTNEGNEFAIKYVAEYLPYNWTQVNTSFAWTIMGEEGSEVSWYVKVYDVAGNSNQSEIRTIKVNDGPHLRFTVRYENGTETYKFKPEDKATFVLTATDENPSSLTSVVRLEDPDGDKIILNGTENKTNGYSFVATYQFPIGSSNEGRWNAYADVKDDSNLASQAHQVMKVYTNEPTECRWTRSSSGIRYEQMETKMTCLNKITEINNIMLYTCKTTLTGLQDRKDNEFYFRCKDQPWLGNNSKRNENSESFKFTLKGTQPLTISETSPNGTIKGGTTLTKVVLGVKTNNGYNSGDASCYYSLTQNEKDYIKMYETGKNNHWQELYLPSGSYTYYFQCNDLGGNAARNSTTFSIEADTQAPRIVRLYNEGGKIKIITDEKSTCSYATNDEKKCDFQIKDGISMPIANTTEHIADWNTNQNYYIKCTDVNDRQPNPAECSIIVRPRE